jgi:cytochrome P450
MTLTVPVAEGRLPVVGHLLPLARGPLAYLQALRAQGDLVEFRLGPRSIVQVNSPDLIRQVLVIQAARFQRGSVFVQARQVLGDGLATTDDPVHMRQRRMVQPAFHHGRLGGYHAVMREQAAILAGSWVPHRPIPLDRELARLTLTVTAKALFRADLGRDAVREVFRSLRPVLDGITLRSMLPVPWLHRLPTPGNRRFDLALRRLRGVVDEVVAGYRRTGVDHGDLLSRLVAAETSDDAVRTQVLHLLVAGTDTTATTLSWACYEIARHPTVEHRLRTEPGDYLDRVLTEAIRLHTPVWPLLRRAVTAVRLGDTVLPAGTEVLVNLPTLHRDPNLFPDPMRFEPDRWLSSTMDLEQRSRFIPFGTGGHKCVGADFAWTEMKTALTAIYSRWHLELAPGHRVRELLRAFLRPDALPMIPHPL